MSIAVVDGHSTGRALVAALRSMGASCLHVASTPDMSTYFTRGFRADDYDALLPGEGDPAALAAELTRRGVRRVVAGTESGVLLADTLTHLMGLPGNRFATIAARRDKVAMGRTAAGAGVAVPLAAAFTDPDEGADWCARTGLTEAVVKPPSSAGTDNVRFCRTPQEVRAACATVLTTPNLYGSPNTVALVQERLRGVEFYANTVSYDGVHRLAELWRYTKRDGDRPVYDYEEPVPVGSEEGAALRAFVFSVLDALGVATGAAHTEVMATARGPVLIESGARLGGGTTPAVVEKYSGVSQTGLLAASLLDPAAVAAFDDTAVTWTGALRNTALINSVPGRVRSTRWETRITDLPTVVSLTHGVREGQYLGATTDLIDSPGHVYLAAEDRADIQRDHRVLRALESEGLYTA
ncbi:hypothetical protein ABZ892_11490 [Streptomyces sp. NPDC046924]|uniref:hypothetical protein n=1 Tax=Streptomyces sp. NPDC046924 TaxID=3155136 RepID=UPI0033DBE871